MMVGFFVLYSFNSKESFWYFVFLYISATILMRRAFLT
ncbi:hypothetical protein MPR_3057 [Myroides profundi]|nr:hypothetical protein MPR_3057 [Myroides profundi]